MKIRVREKGGVSILDLEGNLDINASNFIEEIGWTVMHKSKDILCNFEGVNLVDYVGVSVIAVACKNVLNRKGRIKVYGVPSHIRKIFTIVGLDKVFEHYETEEQALHAFKEEEIISEIMEKKLRRRFKRVMLRGTIEYRQKGSIEPFYEGIFLNVSGVGAFVVTEKTFPKGEILSVRLHLMPKPGIIELEAKVAWLAGKEMIALESPAMGLSFYDIDPQIQKVIVEFVDKNFAAAYDVDPRD
ncbi:MAG: PilZ domain-containing protein [Candidatus Omnitrophota bacterium]|nr:MAG: PilZ domain-containing protein [Candidatus Omnitrophota bacterium]